MDLFREKLVAVKLVGKKKKKKSVEERRKL